MRHLIFIFVDHFEPRSPEQVEPWLTRYPAIAERFADTGGNPPRHTWFYDKCDPEVLESLSTLCRRGLGELEVHLHHGNDTAQSLREKLERRKRCFAEHGALITAEDKPKATFGFIHGKWSLDNSRGDAHCGVNNELIVLREAGCYADFTFPAWGRMQPAKANSIYYATDDPDRAKSYDHGVDVEVGKPASGDLMIFQGPGRLSGIPPRIARLPIVGALACRIFHTCAINAFLPPLPRRVDEWIAADIHVSGGPEWVFLKAHTHGARLENGEVYFGEPANALYNYLESRYNDGVEWRLHYATAREAYNMVKAAEAGMTGDPEEFRNFQIAPYQNTK